MNLVALEKTLEQHNQSHLLNFWDSLSEEEKKQLYDDLVSIDFEEMGDIFKKSTTPEDPNLPSLDDRMKPIQPELCGSVKDTPEEDMKKYQELALNAVSKGNIGVLLLAGGQGTRLGVPYPKGMYNIGLPSQKTLYQIQAERILRLEEMAFQLTKRRGDIVMYIMTSEHTKAPTKEFFDKHNYFGMKQDNVVLFEQRMIPCFDMEGKILLANKFKVARAPDGNGGLYWALKHEKILDHMDSKGVKYLHVYCVDNVLVKVANPVFMGYCLAKGAESGNKVTEKTDPSEGVGVVCIVDDKYQVVEYSEISKHTSQLRNLDGRLTYNAGNICNHFFTINFLKMICNQHLRDLPHHVAKKKIPCVDKNGKQLIPTSSNGIKLEKFVFDVFQFSNNFVVWECLREHEFSPLKNAEGASSGTPKTAREALFSLHKYYIEKAGATIATNNNEEVPVCEISPNVSYAGENMYSVKGKTLESPVIIKQ